MSHSHFHDELIDAATLALQGEKMCACTGCSCVHGRKEAEKLVATLKPIILAETIKRLQREFN